MTDTYCGDLNTFNMDHGYNEALVRGYKSGFLTDSEYHHIAQCENIEGRDVGEGVFRRQTTATSWEKRYVVFGGEGSDC